MKTICKYYGGSILYGTNTPESDFDERGVFLHTDPAYILGTFRGNEIRKQNENEDIIYREFANYVHLLKKGNIDCYEPLFAPDDCLISMSEEFKRFRQTPKKFIDSERFFHCMLGYAQGEFRLANGQRRGQLGSKRKEALDKYGFSPKNFSNLFRILYTGIHFFENDKYFVKCRDFGDEVFNFIFDIKINPLNFNLEDLTKRYLETENILKTAFENRKENYTFDEELVNKLMLEFYYPFLKNALHNK